MTIDKSNAADADEGEADADPDSDNQWKREAMAARKQRDAEKAKRRDMQAKIDTFEAKEREAENEKARAAQDWEKLEKSIRSEAQKQIDTLAAQVKDYEVKEQKAIKDKRQSTFVEMVMAQAGLPTDAKALVEGLLLREEREGADVAPEEGAEALAKAMAKKLRTSAPQLFTTTSLGPKGSPGVAPGAAPEITDRKAHVQELAKKSSWKPPGS
jgi:hypothetical protein